MFIFVATYLGVEDVRLHRSSVSYEELHDVCFEGEINTRQTINQAYFLDTEISTQLESAFFLVFWRFSLRFFNILLEF